MALWRQLTENEESQTERAQTPLSSPGLSGLTERSETKESLIAPGLTIEGKIEGSGHIRIAGRFKGDVHVKGDLTVEQGAHLSGEVQAENIVVKGQIEGNIHATSRVQLLEAGVLIGDLKASSLTVVAGSRMRGKVEFGWEEQEKDKVAAAAGGGSAL